MSFLFAGSPVMQGFQIGKVVSNYDKDFAGMVQVSLHTFEESRATLAWMRVLSPAAGSKKGMYFLPDVGDEVMVGFIDNDPQNAFVLGCLWNADTYPAGAITEKNIQKMIVTKSGLTITLNEEEKKERITLSTPKGLRMTLADEGETITLVAGDNSVTIDGKNKSISVKSADALTLEGKTITIKGSDSIKLESKAITVGASNELTLEGKSKLAASGGQLTLDGKSKLSGAGAQIELKASATMKVESSAMTEIKGAMVKING